MAGHADGPTSVQHRQGPWLKPIVSGQFGSIRYGDETTSVGTGMTLRSRPDLDDTARWWLWSVRLVGGGLLIAMGGIHLYLYQLGFSSVPTIGALFLLNAVLGAQATVAMLATPVRWLPLAAAAGALLQIATLAALVVSLTVGLFGFEETLEAPLIGWTIAVESAGFLILAVHAVRRGLPQLAARRGER